MSQKAGDSEDEISISMQALPVPVVELEIKSVEVTDELETGFVDLHPEFGTTVVVEDKVTRPDGGGGEQDVYTGVVQYKERMVAEFEVRAGSNLLVVWNFEQGHGVNNRLRVKFQLDGIKHFGLGLSRLDIWRFADKHRVGPVEVRRFGDVETETVSGDAVDEIDRANVSLGECEMDFAGVDAEVSWYPGGRFAVSGDAERLRDVAPIVQAYEENLPEEQRNVVRRQ